MLDADIASMQACQNDYFPDVCTVHRPNKIRNVAGGETATDTTPYVNLPCQATPRVLRQLSERIAGERIESGVRWVIVVPAGTLIKLDDTITVTEHGTGRVKTFTVNGIQADESWETAVMLECLFVS